MAIFQPQVVSSGTTYTAGKGINIDEETKEISVVDPVLVNDSEVEGVVQIGNYELLSADGTIPETRLADTTEATQGQVLTLNSNLNAEWKDPTGLVTSVNGQTGAVVLNIPVNASDVHALPDSTKYGANISLSIDSSTYVVTAQLKNQDGNNLGNPQTIDLPLESVVVSGRYDDSTKKVILTLQSGSTVEFSIADLIDGLQNQMQFSTMPEASEENEGMIVQYVGETDQNYINGYFYKCVSDDQTPATYSWVQTNTQPGQVNADWNSVSGVSQILNKPSLATVATSGAYVDLIGRPTIPTTATDVNAIPQLSAIPEASSANEGMIIQYVGSTNQNYIHGYFYEYKSEDEASVSQTFGCSLSNLSINLSQFKTAENPTSSEKVVFVYNKISTVTISPDTYDGDIYLKISDPALFVSKVKTVWTTAGKTSTIASVDISATSTNGTLTHIQVDMHGSDSTIYQYVVSDRPIDTWGITFDGRGASSSGWRIAGAVISESYINDWVKAGSVVNLSNYGISYSGTPNINDKITVDYKHGWRVINLQPSQIPSQVDNNGKFLITNGDAIFWSDAVQQYNVMPIAKTEEAGKIIQYIGETDANYTNGCFYKCQSSHVSSTISISQTSGSGLNPSINKSTFESYVQPTGDRTLTFEYKKGLLSTSYDWYLNSLTKVVLSNYGITIYGTPSNGNKLRVQYTGEKDVGSWVQQLVGGLNNNATDSTSLSVAGNNTGLLRSVLVGVGSGTTGNNSVAIGYNARATGINAVAIGSSENVSTTGAQSAGDGVAIGAYAYASDAATVIGGRAKSTTPLSIQLGPYNTNNEASTFKVSLGSNSNANYKLLDADGTIPEARLASTTSASAGQALVLDSNLNAVWTTIPQEVASQSGQSGKFLTTDGSSTSWANVDALPSQSGNAGKFLKTNGSSATWEKATNTPSTTPELTVAGWSTNPQTGEITQTINVSEVTTTNTVIVGPSPYSLKKYANAGVICVEQGSGTLRFICDTIPDVDLALSITCM